MGRLSYLIQEEAAQSRQNDVKSQLSRLEQTAVGLAQILEGLEERLEQAIERAQKAAEGISVPRYDIELDALYSAIQGVYRAIEGIRFPEIPTPEKLDLSPVLDSIRSLDIQPVVQMEPPVVQVEPPIVNIDREPREFMFHVERNSAGLIESVRVTEQ